MAQFIATLQELKQLPPELHLLCPRQNDDDFNRYDDDLSQEGQDVKPDPETVARIQDAQERRKKFISSFQLLAFDGQESEQYQRYIWERLDDAMGRCDLCIREYYMAKIALLAELREEFDEDEIEAFFGIINRRDVQRISDGLLTAAAKLTALPEQKRTLKGAEPAVIFPIFEAMSCDAFLKDEQNLAKFFDVPFALIQSKSPLKTRDYMPAATRFLFDAKRSRLDWAVYTWKRFARPPTDAEWAWTIKENLTRQLHDAVTASAISRLWFGLNFIVRQLDQKRITFSLCDLVPNVCTTALNHLSRRDQGLRYILQTLKTILEKAPEAFWEAMGSISSSTVIEQIFGSPDFERFLQDTSVKDKAEPSASDNMLAWIDPLLNSLKPASRPAACRTLTAELFKRADNNHLSPESRRRCQEAAKEVLIQTLKSFTDDASTRQSVARVVLSDTLDIVSNHIETILKQSAAELEKDLQEKSRSCTLDIVRNSLALECQCLKSDFEMLAKNQTLQHGLTSYSPDIWNAVLGSLKDDDRQLSTAALLGTLSLPGLEPFISKEPSGLSKGKKHFNSIFEKMTGLFSQILERLSEFSPEHLDELFKGQETSMPLISALFSADLTTYQAAVDLVKNISGQPGRKEAMAHLLQAFLGTTAFALCWTFRRIANMRTFASVSRMMKTGMEILDVLCDTQSGILRTRNLDNRDHHAISSYWLYQWQALRTVFRQAEKWDLEGHPKAVLTEVCRDAMQYAEALFEQYDVFASALVSLKPDRAEDLLKTLLESPNGSPGATLDAIIKWLRLRDEYLVNTLVKLLTKMLRRLGDHEILISTEGLASLEEIATTSATRTMLSGSQKAELVRALEAYYKKPLHLPVAKKQSTLETWAASSSATQPSKAWAGSSREQSSDEFGDSEIQDSDFYELSGRSTEVIKARRAAREREAAKINLSKTAPPKPAKPVLSKKEDVAAFLENRRREKEAAEARRREAVLLLKGKSGIGAQTKGQGSGLSGIGIKGKDHIVAEDSLMVSSESESDSEDEMDRQLFGSKVKALRTTDAMLPKGMLKSGMKVPHTGPVRKIKQIRSQKDMRARLAPDLSPLHRIILGWDFFAENELPPNSAKEDYTLVTNTFKTALDYQKTFEPLLVLEGWQSFRSAREDGTFKSFEVKVSNRLSVDNFVEVSTTMSIADGKELGIGVADVMLLSKAAKPEREPSQPHCLARVKDISRKKGQVEIVYRVNSTNNTLLPSLGPGSPLWGIQILSLTPLEREYGALMALPYYDLCEEIINAKPSPLLDYPDHELSSLITNYEVNRAQAKAVKSALDNDAFTLIQGPPGSGKTKTICALVGAMLTGSFTGAPNPLPTAKASNLRTTSKRLLVCAPSNAAVDELVMRLKSGVKMLDGSSKTLSVVRLGRSDAINTNVKDVTLEELVNARLSLSAPRNQNERDINDIMMEHKAISDELHTLRMKMDECRAQGQAVKVEQTTLFDSLKRKKAQLSLQIDSARDRAKTASRDAELNRRRIQQEILDSAQVLCATLSGSGHDIFQGLNVEFETVIIDEAAQSIELSALIPLKYGCAKCILVGDPKQLPPTVLSREAARFQYEQSLFARMEKNHQKDIHLLDTQYRMHPEISLFPSKTFYDGRLKDGKDMAKLRFRSWHHSAILAPYRFFDVRGMQQNAAKGHSLINQAEIKVAMQLYERLVTDVKSYDFRGKVGIITPYKGQLKELKSRFSQRYGQGILSDIDFNTTDAFQGRESEVIIFSCVRASTTGLGFLNDVRRMNVGLTRAKCSLWVLGNSQSLMQGEFWRKLVDDAKARRIYSDGDVLSLLHRPLLTVDMMRDDVVMTDANVESPSTGSSRKASITLPSATESTSRRTSASQSSGAESRPTMTSKVSIPSHQGKLDIGVLQNRPGLVTTKSSSSQNSDLENKSRRDSPNQSSAQKTQDNRLGPSGGRHGVNPHAMCNICGSHGHFSHNCDNIAARSASLGLCSRCKLPGHTIRDCEIPRCLECGEVGHLSQACIAKPEERLRKQEKDRVRQQEIDFGRERDRARQRRAEKQLGEHAAKVPTVGSSLPSVDGRGLNDEKTISGASSHPTDTKRKREESITVNMAKGSKAVKLSTGSENASLAQREKHPHTTTPKTGMETTAKLPGNTGPANVPGLARKENGNGNKPGVLRPPLGASMVKKKKTRDEDMFMKKK